METKEEVKQNGVATKQSAAVQAFDMTSDLPDLSKAREVPADLASEYWTPETEGEFKLGFYQRIEPSTYENAETGEVVDLPCLIFVEQREDRSLKTIRNGSKRLVAALEEAENAGTIQQGTPLKIAFLGKERNKTNSFMSDRWSVRPLSA